MEIFPLWSKMTLGAGVFCCIFIAPKELSGLKGTSQAGLFIVFHDHDRLNPCWVKHAPKCRVTKRKLFGPSKTPFLGAVFVFLFRCLLCVGGDAILVSGMIYIYNISPTWIIRASFFQDSPHSKTQSFKNFSVSRTGSQFLWYHFVALLRLWSTQGSNAKLNLSSLLKTSRPGWWLEGRRILYRPSKWCRERHGFGVMTRTY